MPPVARIHTRSHYPYGGAPGEPIDAIKGFGSPGETVSLSCCLEANTDVPDVVVEASISGVDVDVHVVHIWDQAGVGVYRGPRVRVPELLLKDDRVSFHDGYTRRCGSPLHIHRRRVRYSPPPLRLHGPVRTGLEAGVPKQLWLTVRIPADLPPGNYTGEVSPGGVALEVEVLPLALAEPRQDLMLWYLGTLDCRRHQHYVRPAVFEAQLRDIYATGFRGVSLFDTDPVKLQDAIDVAQRVGFSRAVVLGGPDARAWERVDFGELEPVVYASDEIDGHPDDSGSAHVGRVREARRQGMRSMASLIHAGTAKRFLEGGDIGAAPDVLSLYLPTNLRYFTFHAAFPELRERDVRYYWQAHMEKPNTHRLLAGIYLWRSGASGIAPYCYQHLPQAPFSPFDDFDEWEPGFQVGDERRPFKDHMATYPARDGAIPTIQWRGLGEGLTDLRYLATLDRLLGAADRLEAGAVRELAATIGRRLASTLERFSLSDVDVLSETVTEPYPDLPPESLHDARRQIARDAVELQAALAAPSASPR